MLLNIIIFPVLICIGLGDQSIFTDLTGIQYIAENQNRMINEVSACFKTSGVQYGPVDGTQYHLFLPSLSPP